uniref:Vitellogenin domain-containing protein n=1 Tax=Anopheles atroparvus TaxID=41427 RepID=A0A182JBJ9_ANOAO
MIAKLLLLTLVGVCTAYQYSYEYEFPASRPFNQTGFEFGAWEPNREYVYNVTTKTMTALPDLEDYWTGIVTHGYLVIRPKDHNYVVAYIDRPTYATFNDRARHRKSTDVGYCSAKARVPSQAAIADLNRLTKQRGQYDLDLRRNAHGGRIIS